jgi:hypothetical protein
MTWTGTERIDPRTAKALVSGQVRFYPMQVLCGACGGLGCDLCAEPDPEPESRWRRLRARLRKGRR